MSDEITALKEEILKLRAEIDQLRSWNPLYKKTIYFLGSSWTMGSATEGRDNFAMRIAARNEMKYVNESVTSTTFIPRPERTDSYLERADLFPAEQPDYVLIQLSSNDFRHTDCPIGHAADFYEEDPERGRVFDTSSAAGAMEAILCKMMTRWPGTKFAWYTGFQGPVNDSQAAALRVLEGRRVLIQEIAPKWGTPVCDLTRMAGLNTFMMGNRSKLTNGDGQHCITAGYDVWTSAIEAFLRSL